jgi:hypothetical protein
MSKEQSALEVFRDLNLRGSPAQLDAFHDALMKRMAPPWSRSKADERYSSAVPEFQDALVFHRQPDASVPGARLFLWRNADHYEVSSIVPIGAEGLGRGGYNTVLKDFVGSVAGPAAEAAGIKLELTVEAQTLDDWATPEVASALRLFSHLADRSTGASHAPDKKRWFDFIVKAHRSGDPLNTSRLLRWLIEVEGWGEDRASQLVIEYEFGLGVLDFVNE